jgi:hypothetical protein
MATHNLRPHSKSKSGRVADSGTDKMASTGTGQPEVPVPVDLGIEMHVEEAGTSFMEAEADPLREVDILIVPVNDIFSYQGMVNTVKCCLGKFKYNFF